MKPNILTLYRILFHYPTFCPENHNWSCAPATSLTNTILIQLIINRAHRCIPYLDYDQTALCRKICWDYRLCVLGLSAGCKRLGCLRAGVLKISLGTSNKCCDFFHLLGFPFSTTWTQWILENCSLPTAGNVIFILFDFESWFWQFRCCCSLFCSIYGMKLAPAKITNWN